MEKKHSVSWTMFRSIFFETLISFFVAFLFFFFIFFVNQLLLMAQEILTKKVPFQQVALLVLYSLPSVVAMSAPFASLVGTLMTIGRMTSDNEILVMLSSGLSYRNVFIPAVTIGIFISLMSFLANDILLPAGTVQFTRLYRRILVSTPALELESNSVKRFKDTVVVTGNVENNSIDDVLILDKTSDGERRLIMARNAKLRDGGVEGMSLDLTNAFIQTSKEVARQDYDYASSSFLRYLIPQDDLIQAVSSIGPREMSSTDVKKEIKNQEEELGTRLDEEYNRSLTYALSLETALRYGPQREEWNQRSNTLSSFVKGISTAAVIKNNRNLLIYRLEYYKKFSIPFGALSFVFLAVSLGLLAKKSGQTVGFIFGLIIAVIYWALLLGGQTMGIRLGYSPFWSMWFPNILAISIGLLMGIIRIRR
ncbi:MAG: LptF/LptG family permease [Spirochaetaceae bacterium]|jgi:lipopolysaccharide export system permease protein|nr:LptF/LptG family permease [Spirochaetaceae bacterium]